MNYATLRRRRYKRLKQKLKGIENLKLLQKERALTNVELEKINKEKLYQQQLKQMYITPSNIQQQEEKYSHDQSINCSKNESDQVDPAIGSYAFLRNLTRHSMYNGKVVKILEYFEKKQRWKVRLLPKQTAYLLVQTLNLSPIKISVNISDEKVHSQQDNKSKKEKLLTHDHISKKKKLLTTKLSIQQKHLLLIFGFIHKSMPSKVRNLILNYTSLLPIINFQSLETMENVDTLYFNFMVQDFDVSVYDSIKILKNKMSNIINKYNIRLEYLHLWFKFGDVRSLLYPLTNIDRDNEMYGYDRLVRIPFDKEKRILLGDIGIVGKLDVKIDVCIL